MVRPTMTGYSLLALLCCSLVVETFAYPQVSARLGNVFNWKKKLYV